MYFVLQLFWVLYFACLRVPATNGQMLDHLRFSFVPPFVPQTAIFLFCFAEVVLRKFCLIIPLYLFS